MVWVMNFRYWCGVKAEMCGMQFTVWPGVEEGRSALQQWQEASAGLRGGPAGGEWGAQG